MRNKQGRRLRSADPPYRREPLTTIARKNIALWLWLASGLFLVLAAYAWAMSSLNDLCSVRFAAVTVAAALVIAAIMTFFICLARAIQPRNETHSNVIDASIGCLIGAPFMLAIPIIIMLWYVGVFGKFAKM